MKIACEREFDFVLKNKITPNQLFILYIISIQSEDKLKEFNNSNNKIELQEIEDLINKKLLKIIDESKKITIKNLEVTEIFSNFVIEEFKTFLEVDEWFNEWYNLFPEKVKSGGYRVKSSPLKCKSNLKKFMHQNQSFDKDLIIKATNKYVEEFKLKGFSYMKIAPYFIYKDNISTLEDYCNQVLEGDDEIENNEFNIERSL
jgi:hypothetical protein